MAEEYLRVQLGLPKSDGAVILKRHLDDPRAWAYAVQMWDWFAEKHPEGQIVGPNAAYLIADGSGWLGDCDKFCAAMVAAGFLASIPEGFRARGWEKWAGYYFTVKTKAKEKKAKQRAVPPPSPACPGDIPGTDPQKPASEGSCPGDPSPISSLSSFASEGVQGEAAPKRRRSGLASPFPPGQDPHPNTSAVLAALYERGLDAAPPGAGSAGRVEAAIAAATLPVAVERLAPIYANPEAKKPLTFHVDAIRGVAPPKRTHGDLGSEIHPWPSRLTPEEKAQARAELAALHPDLADAPLEVKGVPGIHPTEALEKFHARWRAVAEARP
jgi:hypothetical protein